jgi:copper chaperone
MTRFTVPEMTCGHCTAAIEKAVAALDPAARVACDLETHGVTVTSDLPVDALQAAIRDAGYDSTVV